MTGRETGTGTGTGIAREGGTMTETVIATRTATPTKMTRRRTIVAAAVDTASPVPRVAAPRTRMTATERSTTKAGTGTVTGTETGIVIERGTGRAAPRATRVDE